MASEVPPEDDSQQPESEAQRKLREGLTKRIVERPEILDEIAESLQEEIVDDDGNPVEPEGHPAEALTERATYLMTVAHRLMSSELNQEQVEELREVDESVKQALQGVFRVEASIGGKSE